MRRLTVAVLLPLFIALLSFAPMHAASPAGSCGYVRDSLLHVRAGTRSLPARAFADRGDFRGIVFDAPVRLEKIGEYAFLGCGALADVTLPATVKSLGEGVFRECSSLESATLPVGVTVLPRYLFAWCASLKRVGFSPRLADIGAHAFAYCSSLESISFPPALRHIGSNAFSLCTSLKSVTLPVSVTELESYAFSGCTSLEEITFPANPKLLGELILDGCSALRTVTELSPEPPPFDCDSSLFPPEEDYLYARVRLVTPSGAEATYRRSPGWSLFFR